MHIIAAATSVGGLGLVHVVRYSGEPIAPVVLGTMALLCFPLLSVALAGSGYRGDRVVLPLAGALAGLGLIEVYRLQPGLLVRQVAWIAIGCGVLLATFHLARDVQRVYRVRAAAAGLAVLFLLSTVIFGTTRGGARQWLDVGVASFQPSEIAKVLIVLFVATHLGVQWARSQGGVFAGHDLLRAFLLPAAVLAASAALLVAQRDLGGATLSYAVFLLLAYVASGRVSYVVFGIGAALVAGIIGYETLPHVRLRIDAWLNPWDDVAGSGYQTIQALFALGSGGLLGTGLGLGHPELVPAAHTDLVFIAVAEELGLVGAAATIGLFALLTVRGIDIAAVTKVAPAKLLAAGLTALLAVQGLLILGGSTRMLPLTGVTLPFVSYGGSSMVSNLALLGLLLALSDAASRDD
ncbi:MAG: FtsW/RodA/SpoVE family cell cycle protein [bacterium]